MIVDYQQSQQGGQYHPHIVKHTQFRLLLERLYSLCLDWLPDLIYIN